MKTFSKNNSVKLTKQIQRFIVQSISISISTIYGTECNENIGSIILKIRYFITDNWDEKCAKIWLFFAINGKNTLELLETSFP